ncbi:Bug family tripartite tricarboxylate transporter substrate binding protein [Variovorax sp. LjRoot178]|uniref:Bug family tripartite tricarboxylate transporter substrate binding protein n=1 Tax=Variovorax sp. LjRoot178 TaxID=3342277 RepID=UPI003ECF74F3
MHPDVPRISRRALIAAAGAVVAPSLLAQPAYPFRPIRIVVGFPPGGIPDILARLYSQHMSTLLGTPVIVDNKPGALQMNAIRNVTSSPADGYTLWLTAAAAIALTPAFEKDLPYDPLKDFTYLAKIATTPAVFIVANDVPAKTFAELIAWSKKNPGKLNYGSAGNGGSNNIKVEYIKSLTGLDATHVPYKADVEWIREVAAGTVHFGMATASAVAPLIAAGKVRAIGVTSPESHPNLPNVPGTAKMGVKGLERVDPFSFYGFVAPAGLPPAIVSQLNQVINRVTAMPDVSKAMTETHFLTVTSETPAKFREFTAEQLARSQEAAKLIGSK